MTSNQIIVSLSVLSMSLLTSRADIIDPAFLPSAGTVTVAGSGTPVNLGLQFTPVANTIVNALGFYGNQGQSVVYTGEQVAIYDNTSQAIVAEATVLNTGSLTDGYYWQSITPVTLTAGQEYTVDAETGTGGNLWGSGVPPIVNDAITYNGQAYDFTSVLTYPQNTANHASDAYYGPDFSVAAPEPASWVSGALVIGVFAGSRVFRAVKKNRVA